MAGDNGHLAEEYDMIAERLYSWIDVQAALEGSVDQWPDGLLSARAYWDGLVVEHRPATKEEVKTWLADQFGPRWQIRDSQPVIRLESLPKSTQRWLYVDLCPLEVGPPLGTRRRSFRRPDTAMRRMDPTLPTKDLSPQVLAWHSFKGGVGRTTTALQFARLVARREGASVMVVDMDFEAPGISWMTAASRLPDPPIAMSDVLALVHGTPPETIDDVVQLIVHRLQDSLVDGLVVLPALRRNQRTLDVRPEHLEITQIEPLADILMRIGGALGVSHVVADLRAGRSELAASLLLDRRVARALVTTTAGQSVKGTEEMLRDLADSFPSTESDPAITVVVAKLHPSMPEAFDRVRKRLGDAADELSTGADADSPSPVRFTAALHEENLLSLPLDWADAMDRLDATAVLEVDALPIDLTFDQWAAEIAPPPSPVDDGTAANIDERRRQLAEFASPLVTAESSGTGPFLDTGFLRTLIKGHRSKLPVVVAEGAKGAGKTFTFLRMVGHKSWQEFARATNVNVSANGYALPLTWSKNLNQNALGLLDEALGTPGQAASVRTELVERLDDVRGKLDTVTGWRKWWVEEMTRRESILPRQRAGDLPFMHLVDGIEDLLPGIHENNAERMCLRALLQEVPAWLRASGQPTGLVVFARTDYVRAAIPQNTEQFRAQYRPYALKWDRREALRLVRWLAVQAGVIDRELDPTKALLHIWGRKLGGDTSREGITDVWVMDALSTRKEEVQARDLVRLVAQAADLSVDAGWPDRVLAPQPIRDALEHVGKAKIDEIIEEHPDLGGALTVFRDLSNSLRVPFTVTDLQDEKARAALLELERAGIAWRDGADYWLISLYRRGLGLNLQPHRRERVLR